MDETRGLNLLPSITRKGTVYIITDAFPPVSAGSSVLNRNLFSHFSSNSYKIFSTKTRFKRQLDPPENVQLQYVTTSFEHFSSNVHRVLLPLQLNYAKRRIIGEARKDMPVAVIATYPSLHFLKLGYEVARELKLPFFPYLHDTVAEALHGTPFAKEALDLQEKIWINATRIFVMSEGMRRLYEQKYSIDTVPLVHTYLGEIESMCPCKISEKRKLRAFWAGDVYGINHKALARIVRSLNAMGHTVEFATPRSARGLEGMGIPSDQNTVTFYANRSDYLAALRKADMLILALNRPDESAVHLDEIRTIFPTKTPEYLANGKLILVHAPKEYFLSQFFREKECGAIIEDTDINLMIAAMQSLLRDSDRCQRYISQTSSVASIFNGSSVSRRFSEVINETI